MNEIERQAIRAMIRRRSEERGSTPDSARDWLISEGLYDQSGRLMPQYGGATEKPPK